MERDQDNQQDASPVEEPVLQDLSDKEEPTVEEVSSQEEESVNPEPEPAPESLVVEEPTETTPEMTACESQGGYCTHFMTSCKSGYKDGAPLGCPLGRSGKCCLPDPQACKKEGETAGTSEVCCKGLQRQDLKLPLDCQTTWTRQICLKCGDGVCDTSKGEDRCSCPKDCDNAMATGACKPKATHLYTCADGTKVRWCECTTTTKPCVPECRHIGSKSEGWYNSCNDNRYKWEQCSQCKGQPMCDKIGTKSEGWYCDGNLIAWELCSQYTGRWSCIRSPENGCGSVCQSDKDCGSQTCQQQGEDCVELSPVCNPKLYMRCDFRKAYFRSKTCNSSTGVCQ